MASKKSTSREIIQNAPPNLLISRGDAEQRIDLQIQKGKEILNIQIKSWESLENAKTEYRKWNKFNTEMLRRIFDNDEISNEYSGFFGAVGGYIQSLDEEIIDYIKDVQDKINRLESIKERLILFEEPTISEPIKNNKDIQIHSNKIFIVHGKNEAVKEASARLLDKLDFQPIILHEQPNSGRTIIEKFEAFSDVGYAIVLLTPDDVGGLAATPSELSPRARQNVVFELGYFIGKLGRHRVCALYSGVELPSDFSGVVYIEIDNHDSWKFQLAKELKAAGYSVDLNKLLIN